MLERYIRRPFFFFREGSELYEKNMKKLKNQARNEIFRQMTLTLTLMLDVKGCERILISTKHLAPFNSAKCFIPFSFSSLCLHVDFHREPLGLQSVTFHEGFQIKN